MTKDGDCHWRSLAGRDGRCEGDGGSGVEVGIWRS